MPLVTVIITSFNNPSIEQAIRSVHDQEEVHAEIIVVDDCSADNSVEIIRRLAESIPLTLIVHNKNMGVSVARNDGLKVASGDYVNFLDGDDYLLPGKLKQQAAQMQTNPDVEVSYCDARVLRNGKMLDFTLKDIWPPHQGDMLARLLKGNCIAIHAGLVKTEVAKRTGFDASLHRAEDWDFWLRLARSGANFTFLDRPLVVYRRDGETLSRNILPALNDSWKVLAKFDGAELNPRQKQALQQYRYGIRLHRADILLKQGSRKGVEQLAEAAKLEPLGGYRRLSYQIMVRSFAVGRLCYIAAGWLADLKHSSKNKNLKAF